MRTEKHVIVINVTCDECGTDIDLLVPSSWRGGYDGAALDTAIAGAGWISADGADYCGADCYRAATEERSAADDQQ